jgi:hypothetical protein
MEERRVCTGCEGVELSVKAWAEWAFGSHDSSGWVFDSFGDIVHVTRPVIEVFADAAASSRGFGARGGGNVGCEGKVVGGPSVLRLTSGAAVSVPLFQILPVGRCEGVELSVKAWAEWAFGSHDSSGWVFDSFGDIVHVTRPVTEVFADAAASSRGFGARGGGNVGCEGKVVGGPSVLRLTSGAAVSVPLFQILPVGRV